MRIERDRLGMKVDITLDENPSARLGMTVNILMPYNE